jgi:hypothetical protein
MPCVRLIDKAGILRRRALRVPCSAGANSANRMQPGECSSADIETALQTVLERGISHSTP